MEESDACESHRDAILVACLDDIVVTHRATGLGYELHSRLMGTLNIIAEGEERVRAKGDTGILRYPCLLLLTCQRLWTLREEHLPCPLAQDIIIIVRDINVDSVVTVGTAYALLPWQIHHLRTLAQPPYIGLIASKACAVDTALLSRSDADGLTVLDIADRV